MFCPACGKLLPDNANVCPFCGERLPKMESAPVQTPVPAPADEIIDLSNETQVDTSVSHKGTKRMVLILIVAWAAYFIFGMTVIAPTLHSIRKTFQIMLIDLIITLPVGIVTLFISIAKNKDKGSRRPQLQPGAVRTLYVLEIMITWTLVYAINIAGIDEGSIGAVFGNILIGILCFVEIAYAIGAFAAISITWSRQGKELIAQTILRGFAISFLSGFLVGLLRPVLYVVFIVGIVGSIILMKSVDPAGNGILKDE